MSEIKELDTVIVHSDEGGSAELNPSTHNVYWIAVPGGNVMFHFRPKQEPIPAGSTRVDLE